MRVITINISGPVASGKSAVLRSIEELLTDLGYCVAIPDRAERLNPSAPLASAAEHEKPAVDDTVFILTECVDE